MTLGKRALLVNTRDQHNFSFAILGYRMNAFAPSWQFPKSAADGIALRLGLASAGALLLHLSFIVAISSSSDQLLVNTLLLLLCGAGGLSLLIMAGLAKPSDSLRWLILFACVGEVALRFILWIQITPSPDLVTIDPGLYTDLAGQLLRHGENPYTWNMTSAFELYRVSWAGGTPRLDGTFAHNFPYPALAFLLVVPFQAMGIPGILIVSLLAQITTLVLIFIASPKLAQPVILLPIVAGFDFTLSSLIGVVDITWAALLVGMIVAWRKPFVRAVLYGTAIAFKQSPLLVIPFLLLRLWRDEDVTPPVRRVGYFFLTSTAIFMFFNMPFMIWDPNAWLAGVVEPFQDNLILLSQGGLSGITQFGWMNLPKDYFLSATCVVLVLLLFVYWRHYSTLQDVFWVMPGIIMWFSYRSLQSYWVYWVFPLLAILVTRKPVAEQSGRESRWLFTLVILAIAIGILLATAMFLAASPNSVQVKVHLPIRVNTSGQVIRIQIQVTNSSGHILTPCFALQHRHSTLNPLPWDIDAGPPMLAPGQSAIYQISTNDGSRTFLAHDSAQVVVTDAGGDYSLRGVATITADRSFLFPDALPNPAYRYWDDDLKTPLFWGLIATPPDAGTATLIRKDDRDALMLTLDATQAGINRVALDNWIVFPTKPFGIWVFSDTLPDSSSPVAYGLEFDDGQHRLWFLFCSTHNPGTLAEGQYIIQRTIPPRTWIYEEIDLPSAYAKAGWEMPALQRTIYRGLDIDLRTVNIRLFLAAEGAQGRLQAYFGPIQQDNYGGNPKTLMAETFDNPADYYLRLGKFYERGRNYARALEAYQRALDFSPGNSRVIDQLNRVKKNLLETKP